MITDRLSYRSSDFVVLDESHLRDLDNASRAARAARDDLKQTYENDRTAQLRASMRRSKSNSEVRQQIFFDASPTNVMSDARGGFSAAVAADLAVDIYYIISGAIHFLDLSVGSSFPLAT